MRSPTARGRQSADVRTDWPDGQVAVIRACAGTALAVMSRVLVLVLAAALVLPAVAAGARPEPGPWSAPPTSASGARAVVRFTVDPGTGLVQPVVRYRLRRCHGIARSGRVALGLVAVQGSRFEVAVRRARARLRLVGRFDSALEAHGSLRGRIAGRCRIPPLRWTAEFDGSILVGDLEEIADEDLEDGEELEVDDFDEAGEPIEDEELPPDESEPAPDNEPPT
jgi:hypothetical protein